jgi:type I restriction enzyme M protein
VFVVDKAKIVESDDFNLMCDRYKPVKGPKIMKWSVVKIGDVCEISTGNTAPQDPKLFVNGKYPFYRTSDVGSVHLSRNLIEVNDWLNEEGIKGLRLFKKGTILFPKSGASTFLNHRVIMGLDGYVSSHLATLWANTDKILNSYLYYLLIGIDAKSLTADQNYPSLRTSDIGRIEIPLPPLEIQRKIVDEIDEYQKSIEDNKKMIDDNEQKIRDCIAQVWG